MGIFDGVKRHAVVTEAVRLVKAYAPQFGLALVNQAQLEREVLRLYDAKGGPDDLQSVPDA